MIILFLVQRSCLLRKWNPILPTVRNLVANYSRCLAIFLYFIITEKYGPYFLFLIFLLSYKNTKWLLMHFLTYDFFMKAVKYSISAKILTTQKITKSRSRLRKSQRRSTARRSARVSHAVVGLTLPAPDKELIACHYVQCTPNFNFAYHLGNTSLGDFLLFYFHLDYCYKNFGWH